MTPPKLTIVPLSDVAELLPPTSAVAALLAEDPDQYGDERTLWVQGDLTLPKLNLDTPLAKGSAMRALLDARAKRAVRPWLVLVDGSLNVEGAVFVNDTDEACDLIVLGDVTAEHVVVGGQQVFVRGNLDVRGLLWGDDNPGELHVQGSVSAKVALFTDGYQVQIEGPERIDFLVDEVRGVPNLAEFTNESVGALIESDCLSDTDDGEGSVSTMLQREAVVQAVSSGRSPLRKDGLREAAFVPPPHDVFADETPSIENVRRVVASAVLAPDENQVSGWFGQVYFSVTRAHVDEDGDQCHDSVFIQDWKSFDFYIGVAREPANEGLMGRIKSLLLNRTASAGERFDLVYRAYEEGQPGEWKNLAADDNPPVWKVFLRAWRGLLDYVRKAEGQARAGYPLWHRVQQEIGVQGVLELSRLPVFAEKYNDYWDADKAGFWLDDIWVGVRQRCVHEGEDYEPALKLMWENGNEAPGDEEYDAHGGYLLIRGEQDAAIEVEYLQRQSESSTPLPRGAADHLMRILRMYQGASRRLFADHERELARQAEARRIESAARLLAEPPFPPSASDETVFPRSLLALSDTWQTEGRAYIQAIRDYQRRMGAKADEPSEDSGDPRIDCLRTVVRNVLLPSEPRVNAAAMVLQLARVASRYADADLADRFRHRFAYAPDAFRDRAMESGQFIGPTFLLDDGRIVARIGAAYSDCAHWVEIDGTALTSIPALKGLGRSADRRCFARCDGTQITTHVGFDGPEIARFALPSGIEGVPEWLGLTAHPDSSRCDEVIPFNDGSRVLLLNPTGIYLIGDDSVRRIHPQRFDDDGPYTWPKNQVDQRLSLDMLHMALSSDERHIMVGDQDSNHILLDASGAPLHEWEPVSDYPHHAVFLRDGSHVLANSCHLYSGATIIAGIASDAQPAVFNPRWRVYASCVASDFVVLGNAEGYLYALDKHGRELWRHHVGGTISALEISPDGRTIIAGSYAGYLVHLELGAAPDPYAVGTSSFQERRRWIFWEDEPAPIRW